ncbi:MAG TPA: helix-hairpin-helix domain-containing protein [Chitinophagaceae bacterium]|nr:helix-hairpin-helix domain-containing protein [Chitinophagaceae bacterium]
MPKGEWKEYFVFSKKERVAVFILLGIMAVVIFCMAWYQPVFNKPVVDVKTQQQLNTISAARHKSFVDTADEETVDSTKELYTASSTQIEHRLFDFDPNILDSMGWRILGFGEKTTSHILAYRKTTGKFTKGEDLYNVYRIKKKLVAAVLPYVRIGSGLNQYSKQNKSIAVPQTTATAASVNKANYKMININTATPDDFKVFPGVSDAVAARIIKFRTSLKGFTSVDDVAKTYGLPDSSFKIMRPYLKLN